MELTTLRTDKAKNHFDVNHKSKKLTSISSEINHNTKELTYTSSEVNHKTKGLTLENINVNHITSWLTYTPKSNNVRKNTTYDRSRNAPQSERPLV